MVLPEYGRCVFDMIRHLRTLTDKAERQLCAESIANIMASMHPELREQPDFMQCVWDHLAYISEYSLDIDYPYPVTRMGNEAARPEPLRYPENAIRQRHYGHIIEEMLKSLAGMPEGDERDTLLHMVANQMKQSLFNWNRDAMDNEKIAADISMYTDGKVSLDLKTFRFGAVHTMPRTDVVRKKKRSIQQQNSKQ